MINNEVFLKKAKELEPVLREEEITPAAIVSFQKNAAGEIVPGDRNEIGKLEEISLGKGDKIVLDFGRHYVGYFSAALKTTGAHYDAPAYLRIKFAELPSELFENAEEYQGWISRSWIQEEYIHIDDFPAVLRMPRRYAFRYVQIEVIDTSVKYKVQLSDVSAMTVTSADMSTILPLCTGDTLLDEINRVSVNTLKDCMQKVFEDGPKRDRRLWLGDLRLQALANYATFKNYDLVKRCLYLFAGTTFDDGRIGACLFTEPKIEVDDSYLMDYALIFGAVLWEYYEETSDIETLRELYPYAKKQVEICLEGLNDKQLVVEKKEPDCLLDWTIELNRQAGAEAVLIYSIGYMVKSAEALGKIETTKKYTEVQKNLKKIVYETFWDEEQELFVSGDERQVSWVTQIWMVLAEVLSQEESRKLMLHIMEVKPEIPMITPYMYHYFVDALMHCGLQNAALELIKNYWGGMVENGADTFWELYNPANLNESPYGSVMVNSFCHAWSCTPAYFLRRYFKWEQ